ncbi:hypothetical protein OH77DRAFT_1044311 [Trametes cingulata]|nr:hypothetical protein OH77DRAFT_1044311 [Trametes cingulata]
MRAQGTVTIRHRSPKVPWMELAPTRTLVVLGDVIGHCAAIQLCARIGCYTATTVGFKLCSSLCHAPGCSTRYRSRHTGLQRGQSHAPAPAPGVGCAHPRHSHSSKICIVASYRPAGSRKSPLRGTDPNDALLNSPLLRGSATSHTAPQRRSATTPAILYVPSASARPLTSISSYNTVQYVRSPDSLWQVLPAPRPDI